MSYRKFLNTARCSKWRIILLFITYNLYLWQEMVESMLFFCLDSFLSTFFEHALYSSVYLSTLDISKACERVNHRLLLLKLIQTKVSDDSFNVWVLV